MQGTFLLAHADDFEHNRSEYKMIVRGDDGHATELQLGVIPDVLRTGMTVAAYGTPSTDNLSLDTNRIEVLALPAPKKARAEGFTLQSVTTNNVLVLLVKFTDNVEPFTPAAVTQVMITDPRSVANYYSDVSFGQEQLNITVSPSWLQSGIAAPATCDYSTIGSKADAAYAATFPNDHTTYQNRYYVFPRLGACSWAGLAYVGWGIAYSNGYNSLGVYGHELGHNFGLLHAASLRCTGQIVEGACSASEYGDPFDIMGNIDVGGVTHFNAAQKSILNWIPTTSVKTHNGGTASYALSPIESPGGASYAVKIPAAANRIYWIEYRQPLGFDNGLAAYPNNGAQIRVASPFANICAGCADDTELLDMTPATGTFNDAALVAGQSYVDSTYGITITVGSASPTALNVTVASGSVSQSTTTTIASSPNPSGSGTSATFTATVTGNAPTGSVNFKDGASSIAGCSAVALAGSGNSRTAQCTSSSLANGTHSITAAYGGDASNTASSSGALNQTVGLVLSSTSIASSLNPSTFGSSVTFTATVTGAAPIGSVNFRDGTNSLTACSAVHLSGSGNSKTATCTTSTLPVGTHTIGAFYGGDSGNIPSNSTLSQVVGSGGVTPSTTTLASSKNPSTAGASVTFTATVAGTNPTGSVNFKDGASSIAGCSAIALAGSGNSRTAACTTSALSVATHSITGVYGGDAANATSTSAALSQVVNKATSTATVTSSANPSVAGANVTFTATVAGSNPTGSVNFKDGAGSIAGCSAIALAGSGNSRTAACTTNALSAATHSVTGVYGGDASNAASTSATLSQVVNSAGPSPSTTTLTSSKNPSTAGTSVTFTATVVGTNPTGSVNFKDGASSIAGCSAVALAGSGNSRTAACTTSALNAATHSISAA
ncbi:MAG: Ig-like domain repeat protein, partial [Mycobacterium sp.]